MKKQVIIHINDIVSRVIICLLIFHQHKKFLKSATEHNKLTKVTSGYIEIDEFKDSDTHTGYFCYNCEYFIKPNHCMIVTDEGQDVTVMYLVVFFLMLYVLYGHQMRRR